jgi:uncharacterized protein YkwD
MYLKLFRFFALVFISMNLSCSNEDNINEEAKPVIITNYNYSALEIETMEIINNHRVSIGLKALGKINHVSYKSEEHDHYMIANNVVNHDAFVERSDNIIKALGALRVSENVAYNYNSAQGVFDAWMKSPSHKENIIGDFTHFGLAIKENPVNGRKYYTNIFVKM